MWAVSQSTVPTIAKFVRGDVRLSTFTTIQSLSALVFLFLCIFSTCDTFSNSQLECILGKKKNREAAITLCLINGLFVLEGYPAVKVGIAYYKWVPWVMVGCFLSTFAGRFIYTHVMHGSVLLNFLNKFKEAMKEDDRKAKVQLKLLISKSTIEVDSMKWIYSIIGLELIDSITPCLQIYFLDKLLQGKFHFLGFDINNSEYLDTVFPKTAKCDVTATGPSGTIINIDALCILTRSPANEIIFVCASWWLMFLVVISVAGLTWRMLTLIFYKAHFFNKFLWMNYEVSESTQNMHRILIILSNMKSFSGWTFIYFAAQNLDFLELSQFLEYLSNSYMNIEEIEGIKIQTDNRIAKEIKYQEQIDNIENNENISLIDQNRTRDFMGSAAMANKLKKAPARAKKINNQFLSGEPKVKHATS